MKNEQKSNRADANNDNQVDVADEIYIINYLFQAGLAPVCLDAADTNNDGQIDVSDLIYIIQYIFLEGSPPPEPFPNCGVDPTADLLDCATYAGCP